MITHVTVQILIDQHPSIDGGAIHDKYDELRAEEGVQKVYSGGRTKNYLRINVKGEQGVSSDDLIGAFKKVWY